MIHTTYNLLLTVVLGVSFAVTSGINYYESVQSEVVRSVENDYISSGKDDELTSIRLQKICGYTIEEFGESYTPPDGLFNGKIIDVPIISQKPELPNGCEITSAAALLKYLGYNADKVTLSRQYLDKSEDFLLVEGENENEDIMYGPNPCEQYVGDPEGWGYGCYAPVIEKALNSYFADSGSKNKAYCPDNLSEAHLEYFIDCGVPVIVWATIDMKPYTYDENSEWVFHGESDLFCWAGNSHTLVLAGYDDDEYFFMDPNDKDELQAYPKSAFLHRWAQNGRQMVVVKLNDE